jgi:hypothetical protein
MDVSALRKLDVIDRQNRSRYGALIAAATLVQTLEQRRCLKIACLEEIEWGS